jgi:hypothetical protein
MQGFNMEEVVARAQHCGAGMNPEVRPLRGSCTGCMHAAYARCREQLRLAQVLVTPPNLLLIS